MKTNIFNAKPFVIGMIHLKALPGSPSYEQNFPKVVEAARRDALTLSEGGVHGIMIENFFDIPFSAGRVAAETVAAMTKAISEIGHVTDLPLGVNVLRNDGLSAMAIAAATSAKFIRVNVLASARLTDQGIIQGIAYELLRLRKNLHADNVEIFADIDVKHSAPLAPNDPLLEAEELVHRSGASSLIVTGTTTGRPVDADKFTGLRSCIDVPIIIGSGVTTKSVKALRQIADGFIVGTSLKKNGKIEEPVEVERVRSLMSTVTE